MAGEDKYDKGNNAASNPWDLGAKITRVCDTEMLRSLKAFANEENRSQFTTIEYNKWPGKVCAAETISKRFGGWRKALERIEFSGVVRAREHTSEELMENLEAVCRELGRPPGKRLLSQKGMRISERPYARRWGSVRNACVQLSCFKQGEITEDELLGNVTDTRKRSVSLKTRWKVLKRDNYMCVKCGRRPPEVELQVDHIVAESRGGGADLGNLQTLCHDCNQGKKERE